MIAVFDFLSHESMHLPFNEGYLRTLLAAFPEDEIVFHACAGHIASLARVFSKGERISFRAVERFTPAFGYSRHNPLGGRVGAWRCWQAMMQSMAGQTPRLATLMGFETNLLSVLRRVWPRNIPLHLVLHNHLAETARWRSRNPALRIFDLTAGLSSKLPDNIRILALELGIREALAAYAPAVAKNIDVLEHPILRGEWGETKPLAPDEPLRVAFLGHASTSKGFNRFVEWATAHAGPMLEFHAIGIGSIEAIAMDQSALTRKATAGSVPRDEYVAALAPCHLACLPLPPAYQYVASGSVIDAIAGLKPIFCYRNNAYDAMAAYYGAFGYIAPDIEALGVRMGQLDRDWFNAERLEWDAALRRIRTARLPENLAVGYRALVETQRSN